MSIDKSWFRIFYSIILKSRNTFQNISWWNRPWPATGGKHFGRVFSRNRISGLSFPRWKPYKRRPLTHGVHILCYSRRHGRRLQTLDWRKSHLWYNPAPERVGDHLLWVFPGSYVNGLVETIYREIQSLLSIDERWLKWRLFRKFSFQPSLRYVFSQTWTACASCLWYLYIVSTTPKLHPNGRVLHPPIPSNFFSDTPSFTCDIAWYYMILHDITCTWYTQMIAHVICSNLTSLI